MYIQNALSEKWKRRVSKILLPKFSVKFYLEHR